MKLFTALARLTINSSAAATTERFVSGISCDAKRRKFCEVKIQLPFQATIIFLFFLRTRSRRKMCPLASAKGADRVGQQRQPAAD